MKQFTKTLPKRHPLSVEIRELYGAEGFTYLTDLLDLAQEIGKFELTPQLVARECGLKSQKVARIFENLSRIFEESCKILGLSFNNPQKSSKYPSESSKYPQRSTPSNPHGSTHDLEKRREEQSREETTTPLPPIAESENLATENLGSGSGVFFEIENKGQRLTEDEWIYRNLMEHRRNKGWKSQGAVDLQSLISLYPNHLEQFKSWATLPMAKRIAAYAFAAIKVTPDNHFKYALKMAREGTGDEFEKFLYQAQRQVEAKDYLVRIS